jgi:hypothetical protein
MSPNLSKQIKKLQLSLDNLKTSFDRKKRKTIEECTKKKHLELFDVDELIAWLIENQVDLKKINKKYKQNVMDLVLETIEEEYETESSSEDETSDDSDDEDSEDESEDE